MGNRIFIREITDIKDKQIISRAILEALPEWFGISESREKYISDSVDQMMIAAYDDDRPVGFVCLQETGRETVELHVMGVLKEHHRCGIGRSLFKAAREIASNNGYLFVQVKTIEMGHYKEYDDTNEFYISLGFKEFEVIPDLWGKENPCQIYVMSINS